MSAQCLDATAHSVCQGVGDDVAVPGPALTIRRGKHLLVFTLLGATVRKWLDAARART